MTQPVTLLDPIKNIATISVYAGEDLIEILRYEDGLLILPGRDEDVSLSVEQYRTNNNALLKFFKLAKREIAIDLSGPTAIKMLRSADRKGLWECRGDFVVDGKTVKVILTYDSATGTITSSSRKTVKCTWQQYASFQAQLNVWLAATRDLVMEAEPDEAEEDDQPDGGILDPLT